MYKSRLQELMAIRGMNVAGLAARLDPPRQSTQVYRYVNGDRVPSTSVLMELATVLNVSADDLLAPVGSPVYGRPDQRVVAAV